MNLLCALGLHKRSKSQARHEGGDFVSVCKRCRVRMIKKKGRWRAGHETS